MPSCLDCNVSVLFSSSCGECKRSPLCSNCTNYALIRCSSGEDLKNGKATCIASCQACFRKSVSLDLAKDVEEHGPANGDAVSVILVHGGGGSRAMYRSLAKSLVARGYRCVLPDLPSHGGRMSDDVNIAACVARLHEVAQNNALPYKGIAPILLGGSFGGYVGMETLTVYPKLFSAVVLACCSQTVGKGAGFLASSALAVMQFFSERVVSASTFVGMMLGVVRKAKHLEYDLTWSDCVASGMYFHASAKQTSTLRSTDSLAGLRQFSGPVLFINGSQDHRDMLDVSMQISTKREREGFEGLPNPPKETLTKSVLYEGGDHFFSHDVRFRATFEIDVGAFCDQVVSTYSASS